MAFSIKSAFFLHFFAQKFAYVKNFLYLCSRFRKGNKSVININPKSRKGSTKMKTYKSNLESLLAEKQNVSNIRGLVRESLINILNFGYARTGKSSRSGKQIWTNQVADILRKIDIPCKTGNDAARGGANGEFVVANAPEFRTEVAGNAYDRFIAEGREYKSLQEKVVEMNRSLEEFVSNPTFTEYVHADGAIAFIADSDAADFCARRNFMAFKVAGLPKVVELFKAKGIDVTTEELEHNYMAWRNDYKSQIVTADGKHAIFTPCGCNDLSFTAYVAKADSQTYVC